ncbi:hypothetical protein B0H17DRAFT_1216219 [Mycena rosella]|uniref:Uncharacterized protein n=1 Tax=Mycena rosella TaxID=1033263 RepID=A0AAD7C9X5_MYCRO|nr:hypothetical protein B0H17DRAFT_1216219 [Mycena rosella]
MLGREQSRRLPRVRALTRTHAACAAALAFIKQHRHVPFSFSSTLLTYDSARRAHVHPPAPHNARRTRRDVCEFAESRAHAARGLWATVSCSRLGAARLVKTPSSSLRVSPRHSSRSSAAPVTAFVGMALMPIKKGYLFPTDYPDAVLVAIAIPHETPAEIGYMLYGRRDAEYCTMTLSFQGVGSEYNMKVF